MNTFPVGDENDKPTFDDIAALFEDAEGGMPGQPLTPEEAEEIPPFEGPIGTVCARMPDGRVYCMDCFLPMEKDKDIEEGSRIMLFQSPAFRFLMDGKGVVCNNCEKIIREEDAHFCEKTEGIMRYIRWMMFEKEETSDGPVPEHSEEWKNLPEDDKDMLIQLMFTELSKKGTYSPCEYHKDSQIINR